MLKKSLKPRRVCLWIAMITLYGCGASGTNQHGVTTLAGFNANIVDFNTEQMGASTIPELNSPPTIGTARFAGQLAFGFSGAETGTALGDLTLAADFAANDVSGAIDGIIIATQSGAVSPLSGLLSVSGSISGATYAATTTGALTGAVGPLPTSDYSADLVLNGSLRGFAGAPSAASGVVSGSLNGPAHSLHIASGQHYAIVDP